jgi:hypothetical protein
VRRRGTVAFWPIGDDIDEREFDRGFYDSHVRRVGAEVRIAHSYGF